MFQFDEIEHQIENDVQFQFEIDVLRYFLSNLTELELFNRGKCTKTSTFRCVWLMETYPRKLQL